MWLDISLGHIRIVTISKQVLLADLNPDRNNDDEATNDERLPRKLPCNRPIRQYGTDYT